MVKEVLVFQPQVAKNKPETIIHKNNACPFCDVPHLTDILAQEDDRIWLVNKYRTLIDTWQTVLIESSNHNGDISNYDVNQNRKVIKFALNAWAKTMADPKYKSVVLYKNFGPYSGGTLTHPHMQIVGFEKIDGYKNITDTNFSGPMIWENETVAVTLSDQPVMGFVEINVILKIKAGLNKFADTIQKIVQYILNDYFGGRCNSYNLFFYQNSQGQTVAKALPRFVDSPYFVGYRISQVNDEARTVQLKQEILQRLMK